MDKSNDNILKNRNLAEAPSKILDLYDDLLSHDGYGELKIEMKILKRGQKEVIIHCGRQYRYVVDFQNKAVKSSK